MSVIKLDIETITIDDLQITPDNIDTLTVAKVGTSNFSCSLNREHYHGLNNLLYILNKSNPSLIISGIRNPLDRNISFLFDTYYMIDCEPRIKSNNFENIQNTFICKQEELQNIETTDLIEIFKKKDDNYHYHFNTWFEEFFDITKINTISFDKEKGIQLYKINDNQYILFYVLEKYTKNIPLLEKFLKIHVKNYENPTINKLTSEKYKDFKNKIQLDNAYKNKLLNTKIMQYFYSNEDIIKIYNMY